MVVTSKLALLTGARLCMEMAMIKDFDPIAYSSVSGIAYSSELPEQYAAFKKKEAEAIRQSANVVIFPDQAERASRPTQMPL